MHIPSVGRPGSVVRFPPGSCSDAVGCLEAATLGWNVVGMSSVGIAAIAARSVALAGFGLDSLIEIFASVVRLATQGIKRGANGRPCA